MKEMKQRTEVAGKVYAVVVETLGLDESEVDGQGSLIDNYGAESLDFLDLTFRLNKEFGIKLYRGDFLERATAILEADGVVIAQEGRLTQAGVDLLKARMPESADSLLLAEGMPKTSLQSLYVIDTWIRLVNELLDNPGIAGEEYCNRWLEAYRESLKH